MATSSEVDLDIVCVICKECLSDPERGPVSQVTAGLEKIKTISDDQKDNVRTLIAGRVMLRVHKSCRGGYTRRVKGATADAGLSPVSTTRPSLRSAGDTSFNFKSDCFFCSCKAKVDERHPDRNSVYLVSDIDMKNNEVKVAANVKKLCADRNDDWGKLVSDRIDSVLCLVSAEARYHRHCYSQLANIGSVPPGSAYPREVEANRTDKIKEAAFEKLCAYLESNLHVSMEYLI